ncbi:hypothetical protein AJ79_07499 [Helicocarpus griseus UAMH5409]|uniref:Uncharacterized protein n=1 Tax=Helicocarpus griseus UAMH5409 TaxID=1447875 RepID=A0A2B7X2I9_9EURO|nr:hypothetical protein AJ79_07499 [Helicocarpus griseus UAMH5409]
MLRVIEETTGAECEGRGETAEKKGIEAKEPETSVAAKATPTEVMGRCLGVHYVRLAVADVPAWMAYVGAAVTTLSQGLRIAMRYVGYGEDEKGDHIGAFHGRGWGEERQRGYARKSVYYLEDGVWLLRCFRRHLVRRPAWGEGPLRPPLSCMTSSQAI